MDLGVKHVWPFTTIIHLHCYPEEACWKLIWAGQQSITCSPERHSLTPILLSVLEHAHTHTQIHIPLSCLSIVRGKHYWPISELNVSTCHAAGNPLSPPPPAFIVLSCYHAVFFFIHVAPLQEKRQSQETVVRTLPVKWSWSRPTWWLGNELSYLKRLTCITNIIPGTICGLIEKYHLFFLFFFL